MRGDLDRAESVGSRTAVDRRPATRRLRGERARVAARVRDLLAEHGAVGFDGDPGADAVDDAVLEGRAGSRCRRLRTRLPVRVDPGRRTALAVGVAVLIAAIVTGAWVAAAKPRSMAVSAAVPSLAATATPVGSAAASAGVPGGGAGRAASSAESSGGGSSSASSGGSDLVVDVAGKVHRPGLYHLADGARIDDAVRAAGGARHGVDLSSLNLAAKVVDGQQIVVGMPAAAGPAPGGAAPAASSSAGGAIDLNSATLDQLQTLPGVGPVLAQHILDYRTQHGSFASVAQLNDVSGIGPAKFAAIKDLVTL